MFLSIQNVIRNLHFNECLISLITSTTKLAKIGIHLILMKPQYANSCVKYTIGIKIKKSSLFFVDCKLFHSRKFPEDESLLHRKLVIGSGPF